ncbi:hypothetical protein GFS60_07184 (plasmid) [Rhodococcus sp. WAY2]|nr:hypothetical protein GFS60_07184 [Rhodococcus sp. WAY2]
MDTSPSAAPERRHLHPPAAPSRHGRAAPITAADRDGEV